MPLSCWFEYGSTRSWMKSFAFMLSSRKKPENVPDGVFVPDFVMAFTIMPAVRPLRRVEPVGRELELRNGVAAEARLVLLAAAHERSPAGRPRSPGRTPAGPAGSRSPRSPGCRAASSVRSIQLRPFSGSSCICRGSMLLRDVRGGRVDERRFAGNGDRFLHARDRHTPGSASACWPTSSSMPGRTTVVNPGSSAVIR